MVATTLDAAAGLAQRQKWGLILPSSARVSLLTYQTVLGVRYPELVKATAEGWRYGRYVSTEATLQGQRKRKQMMKGRKERMKRKVEMRKRRKGMGTRRRQRTQRRREMMKKRRRMEEKGRMKKFMTVVMKRMTGQWCWQ